MARLVVLGCLVAVFAAVSPHAPADAGDVVASWDFEQQSDLDGWNWFGGEFAIVADPTDEDRAVQLTADETFAFTAAYQVDLLPGGAYEFSGKALIAPATADFLRFVIHWEASGFQWSRVATAPASNTYQPVATPIAVIPCDATSTGISVRLHRLPPPASSATAYVDDLRLELVDYEPCPTAPPPVLPPPPTNTPVAPPVAPTSPPGAPPTNPPGAGGVPATGSGAPVLSGSSANLLLNPGFELADDGRPLAWDDYGGVLLRVGSNVRSGRFAGGFSSASDSTKWAHQTVGVTPAAWYAFDAHVLMNDPRVEAAFLRVSWYASAFRAGGGVPASV